jgi:hypothetical protein
MNDYASHYAFSPAPCHFLLNQNILPSTLLSNTMYSSLTVIIYAVILKKIFGPKRDEVIGGWRKLHNEELHNLYCSPSIIRIIKSRMMRWDGECSTNGGGMHIGFWWKSRKERNH